MDTVFLQIGPAGRQSGAAVSSAAGPASSANLGLAFADVARARAAHPALETKSDTYSYDWVLRAAERVCRYLCARPGYSPGAHVALQLSNSPEYLAAFYGTLLADCVAVPLPVSLERLRRQKIHDLCQFDVLFTRREDNVVREDEAAVATLNLSETAGEENPRPAPRRQGRDLAMLLFTSGSTGEPKGVMLSHRNLLANANSVLGILPIGADDRALMIVPFCHALGNSVLQTHMLAGATLLLDRATAFPASIVDALRKMAATSFTATPEVYGMLLKYGRLEQQPLERLRYMAVAGGELRYAMAAKIAERIAPAKFHLMYGQSEATARLASLAPEDLHVRRGSIGKPIPGVELAVMSEGGHVLPPNAIGILCARGENVMLGYVQDSAATAEVLSGDGWLRTGDQAYRDEEGYFYLQGRANLLVKVQGHRVHPAEIEMVVEAGFPQVRAVALPVAQGDETRFALFLVPHGDQPIDAAAIRATCLRELPSYKVPVHFEVLDQLPLTPAYKVDRVALGTRVLAHPASVN
jgi:long-chain acyl-CoA synthetase